MKPGYEKCEWSEATAILSPDGETVFEGKGAVISKELFYFDMAEFGVEVGRLEKLGFTPIKKRELFKCTFRTRADGFGFVGVPLPLIDKPFVVEFRELPDDSIPAIKDQVADESRDSADKPGESK